MPSFPSHVVIGTKSAACFMVPSLSSAYPPTYQSIVSWMLCVVLSQSICGSSSREKRLSCEVAHAPSSFKLHSVDASCDVGILGCRYLAAQFTMIFLPPALFLMQSHTGCRVGRLTGESCLVQIQTVPVHPPFSVA